MKAILRMGERIKSLLAEPKVWADVVKNVITGVLTTLIVKIITPFIIIKTRAA
jgi:hypothetical protein